MLSYRHSFHSGNHADVLKHMLLLAVLRKLGEKDKAYSYIDSHSGAGIYDLQSANALMNAEYETGVARLWQQSFAHPLLQDYLACVSSFNKDQQLHYYPGSPAVAQWASRAQDRLQLLDLQTEELEILRQFLGRDERISIHQRDAFEGLLALTPPEPRRGLVLIDPSYEDKADYQRVVNVVRKLHRRWSVGVIAIWYPLLGKARDRGEWLKNSLAKEELNGLSSYELRVAEQSEEFGMHGSGMLLVNTPWQTQDQLQGAFDEALPLLGDTAKFAIETLG